MIIIFIAVRPILATVGITGTRFRLAAEGLLTRPEPDGILAASARGGQMMIIVYRPTCPESASLSA
jgi:hypothetical protein